MATIVQRNIKKLGNKFLENIQYEDIDYRGFIGETASPTLHAGAVLVNDMKLWLQSSQGDYYRRWSMGGYLDKNARAFPLNETGAEDLSRDLRNAAEREFPSVEIINLVVVPLQARRAWKITMIVRDKHTGVMAPLDVGLPIPE